MKLKDFRNIVFFVFITLHTFSQSKKITFKVIDAVSKEPLSLVNVVKNKNKFVDFTDSKGLITFKTSKKKVEVSFHLLEYESVTKEYLVDGKTTQLISLAKLRESLNEVVIDAKRKKKYELTILKAVEGTHIYAGKKTEVINLDLVQGNKASNNPRQVFAKVVGLNIYDSNDGGLQLNIGGRGLDPNRTANFNTRQNDYDISADVLGYPESYYTPPTEALEKIQVIRGAASLQYGTQFGGLINFITKSPVKNKQIEVTTRNTIGSFKTLSNFTSLSGTAKGFSYYVYYNGKKGDGFRPNSEYNSNNYFSHLAYQLNNKTKLELDFSHLDYLAHQPGGLTDVQFLENPMQSYLTRNWFNVDWNLLNFKLKHKFTNHTKLSFSFFTLNASRKAVGFRKIPNIFSSDPNNGDQVNERGEFINRRDLLVGKFNNWGTETRFLTQYSLGNQNSFLLLGVKTYKGSNTSRQGGGSKDTDADFSFDPEAVNYENQNNFKFPNSNISVFGENIFKITEQLSITPGLRFEHIKTEANGTFYNVVTKTNIKDNNRFIRNFVLLGMGASYKPLVGLEFYGNFSQNYRSVTFSDIRTVNPSFRIDENITDENGFTFDLGTRGRFGKKFSYDVNIFALKYQNRIGQVFAKEPPFRAQWVRKNIGSAFIYGLESLLQLNLKETLFKSKKDLTLNVFGNFSLTKSKYTNSKVTNIIGNEVEFIPLINLKTGMEFGWKKLLVSTQFTGVSSQFTDASNSLYNPNNKTDVKGAIPSYNIIDISAAYIFNKHFKLETGANNLLNNSYFTRRATGYPGPGIIPAAPRAYYATLEIKF